MNYGDSLGKCGFCGKAFGKAAIMRHLESCGERLAKRAAGKAGRAHSGKRVFELFIEGRRSPQYWMAVEIPVGSTLMDLDGFLRREWLECCGHLSAFAINGKTYNSSEESAVEFNEETMGVKLADVLSSNAKFFHEYDFGSTTELSLKVVSERKGSTAGNAPAILARNEPPAVPCESCGGRATRVCAYCIDRGKGWSCGKCSKKHECGDEAMLPTVNSPRVGTCGYRGKPY